VICQPYSKLIAIKRWADRGLYDVVSQNLERLTKEDASIMLRILDHIHVVDRIFQQGLPHTFQAPRSDQMPAFEALANGVREVDDWYASYVESLASSDFEQSIDFVFTSRKPARVRARRDHSACLSARNLSSGQCRHRPPIERHDPSRDSITDFLEAAA
jgi:hypothetical protein